MNDLAYNKRVDADVHVRWENAAELLPGIEKGWHERWLRGGGHTQAGLRIQTKFYNPDDPTGGNGLISVNDQAVARPRSLIDSWLVPQALDAVILSVYDSPLLSTFGDMDYPIALARAVNEWLANTWLEADDRFYGSICVATQDPQGAAQEIRRAAQHPRMVQVILPSGTRLPYGNRYYHPIYEAAEDCGLALAIHAGTEGMGTSHAPTACGWPGTLAEMKVAKATAFLAHLTSLITEGVFVRFPRLKVVGLETGVAWLPPYLWRFDKNYKGLRSECPWLKELPSDYVRRFFRFGTQGVEQTEQSGEFWRLLRSVGADDLLLFSSNYPRWDHEKPDDAFALKTCEPEKKAFLLGRTALTTYSRLGSRFSVG